MAYAITSYPSVYTMEVYGEPTITTIPFTTVVSWQAWSQQAFLQQMGCGLLANGTIWCPPYVVPSGRSVAGLGWTTGVKYQRVCVTDNHGNGEQRLSSCSSWRLFFACNNNNN
jgi:hypothetical protein